MKNVLIMLAVATIPAAAGCNCCGLANCPCNPCNWFNRGAYCGPTSTYAPLTAAPLAATAVPSVQPLYPVAGAPMASAPYASPEMMGAPMIAGPSAQPMMYAEPGCNYVEPGCAYGGMAGYGPEIPMAEPSCCENGAMIDGATVTTPVEQYAPNTPSPQPAP